MHVPYLIQYYVLTLPLLLAVVNPMYKCAWTLVSLRPANKLPADLLWAWDQLLEHLIVRNDLLHLRLPLLDWLQSWCLLHWIEHSVGFGIVSKIRLGYFVLPRFSLVDIANAVGCIIGQAYFHRTGCWLLTWCLRSHKNKHSNLIWRGGGWRILRNFYWLFLW